VEAPSKLWHLRKDHGSHTLCGEYAPDWPVVLHWQTRTSITCGRCLFALGVTPIPAAAPPETVPSPIPGVPYNATKALDAGVRIVMEGQGGGGGSGAASPAAAPPSETP
jgi:hypothetical protein